MPHGDFVISVNNLLSSNSKGNRVLYWLEMDRIKCFLVASAVACLSLLLSLADDEEAEEDEEEEEQIDRQMGVRRAGAYKYLMRTLSKMLGPGRGHTKFGNPRLPSVEVPVSHEAHNLFHIPDLYIDAVRLTPVEFQNLYDAVAPLVEAGGVRGAAFREHKLTTRERLWAVIKFLNNYNTYAQTRKDLGRNHSSLLRDVEFILPMIITKLKNFVRFPTYTERIHQSSVMPVGYKHVTTFLDCSKIKSRTPDNDYVDNTHFRMDKGTGISLLAYFDMQARLIHYELRAGHMADVTQMKVGDVYNRIGTNPLLLHEVTATDGGFPCETTHLIGALQTLRPFDAPQLAAAATPAARASMVVFNAWIKKLRGHIELHFGFLKMFRSMGDDRRLRNDIQKLQPLIIEAAILLDAYIVHARNINFLSNPAAFLMQPERFHIEAGQDMMADPAHFRGRTGGSRVVPPNPHVSAFIP
jgi:hypothetical protein